MKYVAYYRVSTAKQGQSGLGLEGQKTAVLKHIGQDELIDSFIEVESGKNDNRAELNKALESCKKHGATLIIAKLDRLSRNLTFISSLMDSKTEFVCCDMPTANSFTIHIFAALAQQERELISTRTRTALQAKKKQGVKLGKPENLTTEAAAKGLAVRIANSRNNTNNIKAYSLIEMLLKVIPKMSLQAIADKLNKDGFRTARGYEFTPMQVKRLIEKYKAD